VYLWDSEKIWNETRESISSESRLSSGYDSKIDSSLADVIYLVLLILHVGFITAWLGGGVLFISIITPGLAKISASSRKEFIVAVLPRYIRFLGLVSGGAVVAGVLLLVYITQIATSLAPSASGSLFISVGALIGLAALIVATAVVIPTGNRLVAALSDSSTSDAPKQSIIPMLQKRLRTGAGLTVGLLVVTLVLMIVGASI
jgi:uncharacterized membrane protein